MFKNFTIVMFPILACLGCAPLPPEQMPEPKGEANGELPAGLDLDKGEWVPIGPVTGSDYNVGAGYNGGAWSIRNTETGKVLYVGVSPSGTMIIDPVTGTRYSVGAGYNGGAWSKPLMQDPDFIKAMSS